MTGLVGDSGQCLQKLSSMCSSERGNCVHIEIAQKWQHLTDQRQGGFSKDSKFKAYFAGPGDFLCRRGLDVTFGGAGSC